MGISRVALGKHTAKIAKPAGGLAKVQFIGTTDMARRRVTEICSKSREAYRDLPVIRERGCVRTHPLGPCIPRTFTEEVGREVAVGSSHARDEDGRYYSVKLHLAVLVHRNGFRSDSECVK